MSDRSGGRTRSVLVVSCDGYRRLRLLVRIDHSGSSEAVFDNADNKSHWCLFRGSDLHCGDGAMSEVKKEVAAGGRHKG